MQRLKWARMPIKTIEVFAERLCITRLGGDNP